MLAVVYLSCLEFHLIIGSLIRGHGLLKISRCLLGNALVIAPVRELLLQRMQQMVVVPVVSLSIHVLVHYCTQSYVTWSMERHPALTFQSWRISLFFIIMLTGRNALISSIRLGHVPHLLHFVHVFGCSLKTFSVHAQHFVVFYLYTTSLFFFFIQVHIPWAQLGSKAVKVFIEGVGVLAAPVDKDSWDDEEVSKRTLDIKRKWLEKTEKEFLNRKDGKSEEDSDKVSDCLVQINAFE